LNDGSFPANTKLKEAHVAAIPAKIMGLLLFYGFLCGMKCGGRTTEVTGAGATFVYPILAKWAEAFKESSHHSINYQSIGSGGGIKQIQAGTVDFGASDKPLSKAELDQAGLIQFPIVNGAVVPVVNLQNIKPGEMFLSGPVLADIFLGKITSWNDPQIKSLNKDLNLPDTKITVVHRAEGSGTTFIWSNYLAKVSPEWKTKVGEGTSLSWPIGVAGKGNEGVASYVQKIVGAIGYVEYAYALQNKLAHTGMKNAAGNLVPANMETFREAASTANWAQADAFELILTDAPGTNAWPIAGSTFILLHKKPRNPEQVRVALEFFNFAYSEQGAELARQLHYVPLTEELVKLVRESWKQISTQDGKPIL
jgi:phosphate transport system substrate-binding protein